MIDKIVGTSVNTCPMSEVAHHAREVKDECQEVFGKPSLKLRNNLGGVQGNTFPLFLETLLEVDFSDNNQDLSEIQPVPLFGTRKSSDPVDMELAFQGILCKEMSLLARNIYTLYVKEYKEFSSDRGSFYWLCQEFFQAFDAVLLTGVDSCKDIEQWNEIRQSMLTILVHLSQIPTNIQSTLTNTHNDQKKQYFIGGMKEKMSSGSHEFEVLKNWIQENRGGYGKCPALEDKTLTQSFDLLFDIYGKAFFS